MKGFGGYNDWVFLCEHRIKSADQLNNDGVVALITAIFQGIDFRGFNRDEAPDPYSYWFGGCLQVGNSHNGAYQCALNMSNIALHKYAKGLVR